MTQSEPPVRKTVFGIATSVAAAAITLAIFAIGDSIAPLYKWFIVAATGVVSFLIALASTRTVAKIRTGLIAIGERVRAGKDVEIADISVSSASDVENVRVGSNVRSKGSTRINEAYAKPFLRKYRPIAARNEDKKVFSGLL
jgi:hypothetical protein